MRDLLGGLLGVPATILLAAGLGLAGVTLVSRARRRREPPMRWAHLGLGVLLWAAGNDFYLAKKFAFAIVCVAIVAVIALRWPPERSALTVIAVLLMVSANCHPWYLTWMLPLLVFYPAPPLLLWLTLAPLAHTAVIRWIAAGEWNGSTSVRYYEYVPLYLALAIWLIARRVSLARAVNASVAR